MSENAGRDIDAVGNDRPESNGRVFQTYSYSNILRLEDD